GRQFSSNNKFGNGTHLTTTSYWAAECQRQGRAKRMRSPRERSNKYSHAMLPRKLHPRESATRNADGAREPCRFQLSFFANTDRAQADPWYEQRNHIHLVEVVGRHARRLERSFAPQLRLHTAVSDRPARFPF